MAVVLVCFTASCTAFIPTGTTDPAELRTKVLIGEQVRITKRNGSRVTFVVTDVVDEGIRGENEFVPFEDISDVQVRDHSVAMTSLAGLGLLSVVIIAALASLDSSDILGN